MTRQPGRLAITPDERTDLSGGLFAWMEKLAKTLFSKLPETPVSAVGVNFGFATDVIVEQVLDAPESARLSECGFRLVSAKRCDSFNLMAAKATSTSSSSRAMMVAS